MDNEKTLLQQISEKEEALEKKVMNVFSDSEVQISSAKEQAALMISSSEKQGKEEAAVFEDVELSKIEEKAKILELKGEDTLIKIRQSGEKNLESTISYIIETVTGK